MTSALGWAGLVIVIVTSPAQPRPRTAEGDVDITGLGWAGLVIVVVIQLSPGQERPEAMLTLVGWAGLVIIIVVVIVTQPSPRTAGGDVDVTSLGWACHRYRYPAQPSTAQPKNGPRRC